MNVRLKANILHLGRNCDGEIKRVEAWIKIFDALGIDAKPVPLSHRHSHSLSSRLTTKQNQRSYVPEANLWSVGSLMEELNSTRPDIIVGVTSRCWHPRLNDGKWKLVLDFVDSMSTNYKIRSAISGPSKKVLFDYLAFAHKRAETNARTDFPDATFVYAGYSEARKRNAEWVPNLPTLTDTAPIGDDLLVEPRNDLVFFGALYTPINVNAVQALEQSERLRSKRMLLAGRRPSGSVVKTARRNDWDLVVDFPSASWLAKQAKVAVVPLGPSTGIQNKVLDAAAVGLPQAVTQSVLHGFETGFPLTGFKTQQEAIDGAIELANCSPVERFQIAEEARQFVIANYSTKRWGPEIAEMLEIEQPIQLAGDRQSHLDLRHSGSVLRPDGQEVSATKLPR